MSDKEMMPVLAYADERRAFPNLPRSVPMEWLSEDMAMYNHSQTLKRLKERGGLSPQELWANIENKSIWVKDMPSAADCVIYLINKLNNPQ